MHLVTRRVPRWLRKQKSMCIAPNFLADGTETACHRCWQCREQVINDWVGRNIAEMKTARACHAVTLTYGRNNANDEDHERSVVLTYSDVQKFLKLLRRHGYPVRYFIAGEYGTKKGRAHWHIILYWQDRVPDNIPLRQNWMFARYEKDGTQAKDENGDPAFFWDHGWTYWQSVTPHTARYVCKYLQKGMGDDAAQGKLQMSKYPPLGSAYFEEMAERHAKQGLAPRTLEYSFPGVRKREKNGRMAEWKYMLTGRTAELYLDQFIAAWDRINPGQPRPKSPLVDLYEEHGKIVWDEEKFLHRRYVARWMPKGEGREAMPKAQAMVRISRDKLRAKLLDSDAFYASRALHVKDLKGIDDVEERQRREEQFEWELELWLQAKQYAKFGKPAYLRRHEQRLAERARSGLGSQPAGGPLRGAQSQLRRDADQPFANVGRRYTKGRGWKPRRSG